MILRARISWMALFLLTGLAGGGACAEPGQSEDECQFLRLEQGDDASPLALETAIVRCAGADNARPGVTVDLVAAIHVADPGYYAELNRRFRQYDAVLFELVAPRGTVVPKGAKARAGNPVSTMQLGMTKLLDLQFQLEGVDYTQPNMVHADMSPDEFARSMEARGESAAEIFLRMVGYALASQGDATSGAGDAQVLLALFDKNRALALKRILAGQFLDMKGSLMAIEGPDGSTLIGERNKVAVSVLADLLEKAGKGRGPKKFAVFYGAGHMPDFQERLKDEFGLVPTATEWLTAWDLNAAVVRASR